MRRLLILRPVTHTSLQGSAARESAKHLLVEDLVVLQVVHEHVRDSTDGR